MVPDFPMGVLNRSLVFLGFVFRPASLDFGKMFLGLAEVSRVMDLLSVGESSETFKSKVNSDLLLRGMNLRFNFLFNSESGEPLIAISLDGTSFDFSFKRSVEIDIYVWKLGK